MSTRRRPTILQLRKDERCSRTRTLLATLTTSTTLP